jgi:hypothetical protein
MSGLEQLAPASRMADQNAPWPRRWVPWVVSLGLTLGLFWYLLGQIDLAELARAARGLAVGPLAAFGILLLAGAAARALRFWLLLARTVPLRVMLAITLARNLFADLLPARLGGLSYVYLLTSRARRPAEDGFASLFLAFLFDLIAIAPLLALAALVVGGGEAVPTAWLLAAAAVLGAAAYGVARSAPWAAGRVADWLGRRGPESPRLALLSGRARLAAVRLAPVKEWHAFGQIFVLSLLVRVCKFGSYYYLVLAVMTPLGYTPSGLGVFSVFLGVVGAELAGALPIHGIAGFGTYEAAWAFGFSRLGFTMEHAVISGILAHGLSQIVEYALGGAALLWLMRPRARMPGEAASRT